MGLANYFKETKAELHHVVWPSRREAVVFTMVVILLSVSIALWLGLFDVIFNWLLHLAL